MQEDMMSMVPRPLGESVQPCSGAVWAVIFDIYNNHDNIRKQEGRKQEGRKQETIAAWHLQENRQVLRRIGLTLVILETRMSIGSLQVFPQ